MTSESPAQVPFFVYEACAWRWEREKRRWAAACGGLAAALLICLALRRR